MKLSILLASLFLFKFINILLKFINLFINDIPAVRDNYLHKLNSAGETWLDYGLNVLLAKTLRQEERKKRSSCQSIKTRVTKINMFRPISVCPCFV